MTARYLIRLDDACATMRHSAWEQLEAVLDAHGIRPIAAVVPDNADPDLVQAAPSPTFWDVVRRWQNKGWTIGMHGHRHVFHHVDRSKLLLPYYDKSEFAGLPLSEQAAKIAAAWSVFAREHVRPIAWIAPAHCFDLVTLCALERETPIRIVSDGLSLNPFQAHGFHWLPQQLWSLEPRRRGLWTVCLHPGNMSTTAIDALDRQLSEAYFRDRIVSVSDLRLLPRTKGIDDRLFEHYFWTKSRAYQLLGSLRRALGAAS